MHNLGYKKLIHAKSDCNSCYPLIGLSLSVSALSSTLNKLHRHRVSKLSHQSASLKPTSSKASIPSIRNSRTGDVTSTRGEEVRRGRGSYQMARFLRERTRIGTLINGIDTGVSGLRRRHSRRRRLLRGMVGIWGERVGGWG
jgi:hypothetical protein